MTRTPKIQPDEPATFAERFELRHGPFATEADRVISFVENYCRLASGSWAGKPLRLRDWQQDLIRAIFTPGADGHRKHRLAYIGMPRKNGKSTLAAALALYALVLDEIGGQVYSAAADRAQAAIVHNQARKMAAAHPELAVLIRPFQRHLENTETGTIYRVLSADAPLAHGLGPSFVVFDEVWAQPDRRLWDALSLATGAWSQPLIVAITTAGYQRDSLAYELFEHGQRVASGETDDPTFLFRWWTAPDDLEWDDPAAWRAANPALGDFLHLADFESAIRTTPESEFVRFRINRWTATRNAALPAGLWDACADLEREVPAGTEVVLGIDPSFQRDATALIGATIEERPHIFVVDVWEQPPDDPTWRVPIQDVLAAIREMSKYFTVREVAFDPPRWGGLMAELERDGLDALVVPWPTGTPARISPAWLNFYDAIAERAVTHDGDERLARHLNNMIVKSDRLGPRPTRDRNAPRSFIDAGIAAVIAYDRATHQEAVQEAHFAWA